MQRISIIEEIKELKIEKNAVILAHCYQNIEIDEVADFVGDSLFLSQQAAITNADIIVFAGVYFMAETAKILSPDKKVLLPRLESGCLMADMINLKELRNFKSQYPSSPVVCYVNSTAEIKAESDICCTSANAVEIVKSLSSNKILFVPDRGLGTYVASQLSNKEIISYYGYCPTHMRILPNDITDMKNKYPDAEVMAHPECHMEVIKIADYVGSTSGIIKRAKTSSSKRFIIATENGVVERLRRDIKDKEFILATDKAVCENMKWNTLEDILHSLKTETPEINVPEDIREKAYTSISRMLAIHV
ncbi:MAG: quinolinate synthase NadA [Candidatus Gastranaerophilales bacterium]|nr:quinolinate synthase NadA [Candidatus Gastranaerophilales bacterium]